MNGHVHTAPLERCYDVTFAPARPTADRASDHEDHEDAFCTNLGSIPLCGHAHVAPRVRLMSSLQVDDSKHRVNR